MCSPPERQETQDDREEAQGWGSQKKRNDPLYLPVYPSPSKWVLDFLRLPKALGVGGTESARVQHPYAVSIDCFLVPAPQDQTSNGWKLQRGRGLAPPEEVETLAVCFLSSTALVINAHSECAEQTPPRSSICGAVYCLINLKASDIVS